MVLPRCVRGPIDWHIISSPIGKVKIQSCPFGLHSISFSEFVSEETFNPDPSIKVAILSGSDAKPKPVLDCLKWLQTYFQSPAAVDKIPKPPLCLPSFENATFQERVWLTLGEQVKVGQTISYGQLAEIVNHPGAARAVGSAMRRNPFVLVIPCHRVIRSDSSLGQYAGGSGQSVKGWLLQHEGGGGATKP